MAIQFLFPTSRQFPHDEVCGQIVTALAERNFEVPGLRVTLRDYGSGEQWLRHVSSIDADDLHLWFGRPQGAVPGNRYNNVAAIGEARIPKLSLSVFDDESGPRVHIYVGDDWARDRATFLHGSFVNSRLSDRPRTYLSYRGRAYHGRPSRLRHDNDLKREYDLAAGDPAELDTAEVMERVRAYLAGEVLPRILAHPVAERRVDLATPPVEVPVVACPPLFCLGSAQDARRIRAGREELPLADRYGKAQGWRLVPLGTRGAADLPEVVRDSFVWCGIGDGAPVADPARTRGGTALPVIPGYHEEYNDRCVIRVRLASARAVYVVDHGAWVAARTALIADLAAAGAWPQRSSLTQAEVDQFYCARARTLVPLVDYQGGYAQPVVLVGRELTLDEVEVVAGEARP